jgi:assimilatory nitrate reductase catalytic subunit
MSIATSRSENIAKHDPAKSEVVDSDAASAADGIVTADEVEQIESVPRDESEAAEGSHESGKRSGLIESVLLPLLHASDGPLTRDLVLQPGKFGLGRIPNKLKPDATTQMVCGFCSTGCSLNVHLRENEAINLTPTTDYPVNSGMACPKGWEALSVMKSADRGTTPLLRDGKGRLKPVDWDRALTTFRDRFKEIQNKHGDESVAFLSTGQIPSEEMALLGALTKFGMGIRHGDGNTRQCMATAVVAYKQSFGFDAPPYTYQDFEESDVLVFVGANPCIAHPIMWQRVLNNPHNPEIIVLDPRTTETAIAATQHVPLRPKSDLAVLYALAHILIQQGWIDRDFIDAHTSGFDEFSDHVQSFTPESVSVSSGISIEQLQTVARTIREGKRVSLWWTMGVNQSYEGVRTAQAIINIALMTGNIGRPGTGANSITGQCNAMGSRLFSNTTNLLGGHDFANPQHRQKVANVLNIDEARIPDQGGWSYNEIIEGILRGKIKGLWVVCTNTAHSWINQNTCREILDRLDFLVVQDAYSTTETATRADLFLPAAGWGEKQGTFINSERRFGLIKKVAKAPGKALADFSIFRAIAEYWGCGEMFADWSSPEAVFQKLKELSRDQPCDITGIRDYRMIDECGGIQWPFTESDAAASASVSKPEPMALAMGVAASNVASVRPAASAVGSNQRRTTAVAGSQRRLFADGKFHHPDGKAKFLFEQPRKMPEPPSKRHPYLLLTGRGTAAQWHTQTRTAKSSVLRRLGPQEAYVEINPHDARNEGITPNQEVIVESQRGRIRAKAFVTPTVQPGQVFIPMHYEVTNKLTFAHFDPYSQQPSYKNCAVRVRCAEAWEVD